MRGRRTAFSYRSLAGGAEPVDLYREIFTRASSREDELARHSGTSSVDAAISTSVFVSESAAWLALARERARTRSLDAAAERWLSRALPARAGLTLYFESGCRQACEFCEVPQGRAEPHLRLVSTLVDLRQRSPVDLVSSGAFGALVGALARRGPETLLTLTGHDWLEHPRLDALLRVLERQSAVRLRVYGPQTRLASPTLAARVARLPGVDSIGLTLESVDEATHDAIVGAEGVGALVKRAITNLGALGAPVQITLVLTRRALPTLAATVRWIHEQGRSVTLQALLPDRGLKGIERIQAASGEIHRALDALDADAHAAIVAIVGLPRCAVPTALRARLLVAPPGRSREPLMHVERCGGCAARAACAGVPASYVAMYGDAGVAPIGDHTG